MSTARERVTRKLRNKQKEKDRELAKKMADATLTSPEEQINPAHIVAVSLNDPTTVYIVPQEMHGRSLSSIIQSNDFLSFLSRNINAWNLALDDVDVNPSAMRFSPPVADATRTTFAQWQQMHRASSAQENLLPAPTIVLRLRDSRQNASRDALAKELEKARDDLNKCSSEKASIKSSLDKCELDRAILKVKFEAVTASKAIPPYKVEEHGESEMAVSNKELQLYLKRAEERDKENEERHKENQKLLKEINQRNEDYRIELDHYRKEMKRRDEDYRKEMDHYREKLNMRDKLLEEYNQNLAESKKEMTALHRLRRMLHTRNLLELYHEHVMTYFPQPTNVSMNDHLQSLRSRDDFPSDQHDLLPLVMNDIGNNHLYGEISNNYIHRRSESMIERYVLATPATQHRTKLIKMFKIVYGREPQLTDTDEPEEIPISPMSDE